MCQNQNLIIVNAFYFIRAQADVFPGVVHFSFVWSRCPAIADFMLLLNGGGFRLVTLNQSCGAQENVALLKHKNTMKVYIDQNNIIVNNSNI